MRPRDSQLAAQIRQQLIEFSSAIRPLPGIADAARLTTFCEQLLESIHRVQFVQVVRHRQISERRGQPNHELFDPLKAAILQQRSGNIEEAFWLVFLFVHFGRHSTGGWRYAREVYGRLGTGEKWDWPSVSQNTGAFREWLNSNQDHLKRPGCGFGNHRKRESLDALSGKGTGAVVESYVEWTGPARSHQQLFSGALAEVAGDARAGFDRLYNSMSAVIRFGRLARFDYLSMIGKLRLAPIIPGSPYLEGSSGPLEGARLLFGGSTSASILNTWVSELDQNLNVGMQVLEDALCNWQKSPAQFVAFRG